MWFSSGCGDGDSGCGGTVSVIGTLGMFQDKFSFALK